MTFDEILEYVGIEAETLLQPQTKAVFKKILDPYFEKVSAFKKHLDPYVNELIEERDQWYKAIEEKKTKVKSKLLDMDNSPGKDYIQCTNLYLATNSPPHFDVYYPYENHGRDYICGWIPQKAYENDPLVQLLSYAGYEGPKRQNSTDLTLFQFAIVAILYDAPRLKNGCNLVYFGNGDDLADQAALEFKAIVGDYADMPYSKAVDERVFQRLKNALDTVMIRLNALRAENSVISVVDANKDPQTIDSQEINLTEGQVELLNWYYEMHPQIVCISKYCKRSSKTNRHAACILRDMGFVKRPDGKKQGDFITAQGRSYIEEHFS